jgi:hypothetical protein
LEVLLDSAVEQEAEEEDAEKKEAASARRWILILIHFQEILFCLKPAGWLVESGRWERNPIEHT